MSNTNFIGATFLPLVLNKYEESTAFLIQLEKNVRAFIDILYRHTEVKIGTSWDDELHIYEESPLAVVAIKFLKKHQFNHGVFSELATLHNDSLVDLSLDCLCSFPAEYQHANFIEWHIKWEDDVDYSSDAAAVLFAEMLATTKRNFPEFQGSLTYSSLEMEKIGAFASMASINEKRTVRLNSTDFHRAAQMRAVSILVKKALIMELYDDGEREFQTEFEHWCMAIGATSQFEDAYAAGASESDAFYVTITPTDYPAALMLQLSPRDLLLAKFLHWVQGWRFLDQYETSISQKNFFDREGNPVKEVTDYVTFEVRHTPHDRSTSST